MWALFPRHTAESDSKPSNDRHNSAIRGNVIVGRSVVGMRIGLVGGTWGFIERPKNIQGRAEERHLKFAQDMLDWKCKE